MDLPLVNGIKSIEDFRRIPEEDLEELAAEIRSFLIKSVSKTGGHLSSNLGAVELTIALQRAFDTPGDRLIFDVGHQSYVNKILTGRAGRMNTLRQMNGLSGFPKRSESRFDAFNTGHASTSISAALGMLRAMRLRGDRGRVAAVIGDGALTGGMAFEALNDAGQSKLPLIVVLNDNAMSISKNVGALSRHLSSMRASRGYIAFKRRVVEMLDRRRGPGPRIHAWLSKLKSGIKYMLLPNALFEEMGFTYIGPADGHDIKGLINTISRAENIPNPVLIHVLTVKGRGCPFAEKEPDRFHSTGRFCPETGESSGEERESNSLTAGKTLCELGGKNDKIAVITAAMSAGTGMEPFRRKFPDRFFDVGIAEQHAVTMAAGMAAAGMRPVAAIYSTFLQRAYDQIIHDAALQKLPVVFAVDRAGLVGEDGETHQGVYDIAFLLTAPGLDIYSPATKGELREMLAMSLEKRRPAAVRYGREPLPDHEGPPVEYGRWAELRPIAPVTVIATGGMVGTALEALSGIDAGLVNARFIAPMDEDMLERVRRTVKIAVTAEDGIRSGGLGSRVAERLSGDVKVVRIGVREEPVPQATAAEQAKMCGMDAVSVRRAVLKALEEID